MADESDPASRGWPSVVDEVEAPEAAAKSFRSTAWRDRDHATIFP
jgi:hypothetical protein